MTAIENWKRVRLPYVVLAVSLPWLVSNVARAEIAVPGESSKSEPETGSTEPNESSPSPTAATSEAASPDTVLSEANSDAGSPVETNVTPRVDPRIGTALPPADPARAAWFERFERARALLFEEREDEAASEFDELAATAPTGEDRKVVEEFAGMARARLGERRRQVEDPHIRTPDEMSILYSTAFIYGFGTSAWIALQVKPDNFAGAVVPFVVITTATVGGVAIADNYSPFRRGVPQSMSAGMFLGLGGGVWLTGYQHAVATRRGDESHWKAEAVSTALWSTATFGALAGAGIGVLQEPTPGRVSFVTSSGVWSSLFSAFVAGSTRPDPDQRREAAFFAGGLTYNVGLLTSLFVFPDVSPSVARVRFVDLGGIAGGLLGVGGYLVAAGSDARPRGGLLSAGVGMGAGLGLAWWITDGMPDDRPSSDEPATVLGSLRPTFTPIEGGWLAGISGSL